MNVLHAPAVNRTSEISVLKSEVSVGMMSYGDVHGCGVRFRQTAAQDLQAAVFGVDHETTRSTEATQASSAEGVTVSRISAPPPEFMSKAAPVDTQAANSVPLPACQTDENTEVVGLVVTATAEGTTGTSGSLWSTVSKGSEESGVYLCFCWCRVPLRAHSTPTSIVA